MTASLWGETLKNSSDSLTWKWESWRKITSSSLDDAISSFFVPPANPLLLYAPVLVLRNENENLRLLYVLSSLYFACYSSVLFVTDDCDTQRIHQMVALKFVVLTLSAICQTICHAITTRYHGAAYSKRVKREALLLLWTSGFVHHSGSTV